MSTEGKKYRKKQFLFMGEWIPDEDPLKIGEKNFADIQNYRYGKVGLKGILGYSKINATALTTYLKGRTGTQLISPYDNNNRILVQALNSADDASAVLENKAVVPAAGDFEASVVHTDASGAGLGRFSKWPGGNIAYANGKEVMIYAGEEMNVSGFINYDPSGDFKYNYTEVITNVEDDVKNIATLHRVSESVDSNTMLLLHFDNNVTDSSPTTPHTVTANNITYDTSLAIFGTHSAVFNGSDGEMNIPDNADFNLSGGTFTIDKRLRLSSLPATGHIAPIYYQETDADNYFSFHVDENGAVKLSIYAAAAEVVALATADGIISVDTDYHIELVESGDNWWIFIDGVQEAYLSEVARAADYTQVARIGYDGTDYLAGRMDEYRVSDSARHTSAFEIPVAAYGSATTRTYINIGSTRPLKAIKPYIKTANTSPGVLTIDKWDGSGWAAVANLVDGTMVVIFGSLNSDNQGDPSYGVWGDGTYIYLANSTGGLHSYSVDGVGNLTHIDFHDPGHSATQVWGDGSFIYLANSAGGIHSYSVDGAGVLTHIDSDSPGVGHYASDVWGDGNYIYMAQSAGGLHSYSVDGAGALTLIDSESPASSSYGVWGDGNYIYLANSGGMFVYSVDGAGNLTFVSFAAAPSGTPYCVWGDGNFIYIGCQGTGGVHTCSVDGAGNLTYIDFHDPGDAVRYIWGDGNYIYVANGAGGLHVYSVDDSGNLTHLESDNPSAYNSFGVWGDGNFVYLANGTGGLYSYSAYQQVPLGQTGIISFDSTVSTAKIKAINSTVLYWYRMVITDADDTVTLSHVSVDAPFQAITDIWDGLMRTAISFQVYDSDIYHEYTLNVANKDYNTNNPVTYAKVGGINPATDFFIIGFDDRIMGVKFVFGADYANTVVDTIMTVENWNGDEWQNVGTIADGTIEGNISFAKTGLVTWNPADDNTEFRTEIGNDTSLYFYKFSFSKILRQTVRLDYTVGIPAPRNLSGRYIFPFSFQNKPFLCGYTAGKEGNRIDYGMTHSSCAFNGEDSSFSATGSIYFGGQGDLTAACQIYNRFGSSIYNTGVFCKNNETYLLNGYDADTWRVYQISEKIGCPAPLTMDTAEVGYGVAQDAVRNIALWLSYKGPVLFDGAVLVPISDRISCYFDKHDARCINYAAIDRSRGWVDPDNMEYNLEIPSGSGQTECNVWLVFDLVRKKWTKKVPKGTNAYPQAGFRVEDDNGAQYVYGLLNAGRLMRLEHGNNWDGEDIEAHILTADQIPTGDMWDITGIRRLKLALKSISEITDVSIDHYADGEPSPTALAAVSANGSNRLVRDTQSLKLHAWSHQFKFSMATGETALGVELLGWGYQYEVLREDK